MCARVRLVTDYSELKIKFWVRTDAPAPNIRPSWNIAPTQDLTVLVLERERGERQIATMRWGLIPSWSRDAKMAYSTFNARAEGIDTKPAFRDAWRQARRCLVITNGFYEWDKRVGVRQPYAIARAKDRHTVMAGLWEEWRSEKGERIRTVTIITTQSNSLIKLLHDRMPVILAEEDWPKWLGEVPATEEELKALLKPYPSDQMELWPVDKRVGNVKNDGPELVRPLQLGESQGALPLGPGLAEPDSNE
jgi:putative SOS response-associated peptidase YedK